MLKLGNMLHLVSVILIVVLILTVYNQNKPRLFAFSDMPQLAQYNASDLPVAVKIPYNENPLPLIYKEIVQNNWPEVADGVVFINGSGVPGEAGNSIMYGHNWSSLLGKLDKVQTGDKIVFYYVNGTNRSLTVKEKLIVDPDDTWVVNTSIDPKITIYTCTGFLDSKRLIVVAS